MIATGTAVQEVVAAPPEQPVAAAAPVESVIAAAATKGVVAAPAAQEVVAAPSPQDVAAATTTQEIGARPTDEAVVARATAQSGGAAVRWTDVPEFLPFVGFTFQNHQSPLDRFVDRVANARVTPSSGAIALVAGLAAPEARLIQYRAGGRRPRAAAPGAVPQEHPQGGRLHGPDSGPWDLLASGTVVRAPGQGASGNVSRERGGRVAAREGEGAGR